MNDVLDRLHDAKALAIWTGWIGSLATTAGLAVMAMLRADFTLAAVALLVFLVPFKLCDDWIQVRYEIRLPLDPRQWLIRLRWYGPGQFVLQNGDGSPAWTLDWYTDRTYGGGAMVLILPSATDRTAPAGPAIWVHAAGLTPHDGITTA
ncbi:MAG: hypothetical protein ABWX68_08275 [Arthrobacter sp.]|uniref:hypothetical protein n=1 Tax=Arthrobacter sp. TaxID=1667 RepID=UPI00347BBC2A